MALTARALDWAFMPWQRLVLDTATEVDQVTGEWAYPLVVLTVQRQAGKTVLVGANSVHRCLSRVDAECWYTAQRRQNARDNFMKLVRRIRRSPVLAPPFAKIRESNGSEAITFPTGSSYGLFAPTDEALHGTANALVNVDEAWTFDEVRGDQLQQAIMPTFTTVDGQLWIFSAAGNADSTWLNTLMDTGRLAADAGSTTGMAYFELGIGDDVDPTDLAAVQAAHPANGYTLRPGALAAAAAAMKPEEFARAYGNRRTAGVGGGAIPALVWARAADTLTPLPEPGGLALGFDVGRDGEDAAIVAAWRDKAGVAHVEVADLRPGTTWLVPRLAELCERHRPRAIRYDRLGPAVAAGDAARLSGVDADPVTFDDLTAACPALLAGLAALTVRHRPHPGLDAAVAAAGRRDVADRWVWGRRAANATIAALVAATVAVWAYDHSPPVTRFKVR